MESATILKAVGQPSPEPLSLCKIEEFKLECDRKFFAKISSEQVKYDVVDSYSKLMQLVQ